MGEDDSDDSAPGNISNFPLSEQSSLFCLASTEWGYTEPQGKKALKDWHLQQRCELFLPSQKVSKQLCFLALSERMTLLLVQWEVSATAQRTAAVCTNLCKSFAVAFSTAAGVVPVLLPRISGDASACWARGWLSNAAVPAAAVPVLCFKAFLPAISWIYLSPYRQKILQFENHHYRF